MARKTGAVLSLKTGAAGQTAATAIDHIRDGKFTVSTDSIDATDRGTGGWKVNLPSLRDATLSFKYIYDSADSSYETIRTNAFAGTATAFLVGCASGTFDADFIITKWDEDQGNENLVAADVEAKLFAGTRTPVWTTPTTQGSNEQTPT